MTPRSFCHALIRRGRLWVAMLLMLLLGATTVRATPARAHSLRRGHPRDRCRDAGLVPSPSNLTQVRRATLCLINLQRSRHGERALAASRRLWAAAAGHSANMVALDYFDHVSPNGQTFLQRILRSGYVPRGDGYVLGENIALGSGSLATPAAIVRAWMASPEHRANILDGAFTDSGIGIVASVPSRYSDGAAGATYTQDFGALQRP